jgi:hypothetical protein
MCGDANLFLMDDDASEDYAPPPTSSTSSSSSAPPTPPKAAEVMVMVADPSFRRKGVAREAVRALMQYAALELGVRRFVAKISDENEASMRLFGEALGYRVARRMPHFNEVHYALDVEVKEVEEEDGEVEGQAAKEETAGAAAAGAGAPAAVPRRTRRVVAGLGEPIRIVPRAVEGGK